MTSFLRRAHFLLTEVNDEEADANDDKFRSFFIFASRKILNVTTPHLFGYMKDEADEPNILYNGNFTLFDYESDKELIPKFFQICCAFSPSTLRYAKTTLLTSSFAPAPSEIPYARRLHVFERPMSYSSMEKIGELNRTRFSSTAAARDYLASLRCLESLWLETSCFTVNDNKSMRRQNRSLLYLLLALRESGEEDKQQRIPVITDLGIDCGSFSEAQDNNDDDDDEKENDEHENDQDEVCDDEDDDQALISLEKELLKSETLQGFLFSPTSSSSSIPFLFQNLKSLSFTAPVFLQPTILFNIAAMTGSTLTSLSISGDFCDHKEADFGKALGQFKNLQSLKIFMQNEIPHFKLGEFFRSFLDSGGERIRETLRHLSIYLWDHFDDDDLLVLPEFRFLSSLVLRNGLYSLKNETLPKLLFGEGEERETNIETLHLGLAIHHPLLREHENITEDGLEEYFKNMTRTPLRNLTLDLRGRPLVTGEKFPQVIPMSVRKLTLYYNGRVPPADGARREAQVNEELLAKFFENVKSGFAKRCEKKQKEIGDLCIDELLLVKNISSN